MNAVAVVKPRDPREVAAAVTRIAGALGWAGMAAATGGRSLSLMRKWADPDRPEKPSFDQALALDRVYAKARPAEVPPLYRLYGERLEHARVCDHAAAPGLADAGLEAAERLGRLAAEIRAALAPTGPGGHALTPLEALRLHQLLAELHGCVHTLEDAIDAASAQTLASQGAVPASVPQDAAGAGPFPTAPAARTLGRRS